MAEYAISRRRALIFSLILVGGFFLLVETGLRLIGFSYTRPAREMWFAYPDPETLHKFWQTDPVTLGIEDQAIESLV